MKLTNFLRHRIFIFFLVIADNLSNKNKLIGFGQFLFVTINGVHNIAKLIGLLKVGLQLLCCTHIIISFRDYGNKQIQENDNVEDHANHEDKEVRVVVIIQIN